MTSSFASKMTSLLRLLTASCSSRGLMTSSSSGMTSSALLLSRHDGEVDVAFARDLQPMSQRESMTGRVRACNDVIQRLCWRKTDADTRVTRHCFVTSLEFAGLISLRLCVLFPSTWPPVTSCDNPLYL